MLARGCLLAVTGKASDAVQMISSGIAALRSTGATMCLPFWLPIILARAYAELGQFDDAWHSIDDAMTAMRNNRGKMVSKPRSIESPVKSR